ncbi:MAG: hypothetical protein IAF38_15250 [Bacteroidia bacterium]|nr:hypothetical protein [Bacteroidia bacterium]
MNVQSAEKHQSRGVEITYSRIKSVCTNNGLDTADCFSIEDRFDAAGKICGTSVKIKLPLIENF